MLYYSSSVESSNVRDWDFGVFLCRYEAIGKGSQIFKRMCLNNQQSNPSRNEQENYIYIFNSAIAKESDYESIPLNISIHWMGTTVRQVERPNGAMQCAMCISIVSFPF